MFLHGDDFASVGNRASLRWFRERMEQRFGIKTSVVGTGFGEVQEARVLNRIVRITSNGWEYEPDQRHAEMIVEQLGLKEAKAVETPRRRRRSGRQRRTPRSSTQIARESSAVLQHGAITSQQIGLISCLL